MKVFGIVFVVVMLMSFVVFVDVIVGVSWFNF